MPGIFWFFFSAILTFTLYPTGEITMNESWLNVSDKVETHILKED